MTELYTLVGFSYFGGEPAGIIPLRTNARTVSAAAEIAVLRLYAAELVDELRQQIEYVIEEIA